MIPKSRTVVGIATENYDKMDDRFSFDVCHFHAEKLTEEQCKEAQDLREKLGWFPDERKSVLQADEYRTEDT